MIAKDFVPYKGIKSFAIMKAALVARLLLPEFPVGLTAGRTGAVLTARRTGHADGWASAVRLRAG